MKPKSKIPDLPVPEDFEGGFSDVYDLDDNFLVPPLPPDGGWGWAVVIGSFVTNVILDSVCLTYGIFLIEFCAYFDEPIWKLSIAGSLIPGLYLAVGPFASALSNKYSCRAVSIFGSLLAATAFFIASFAKNVYVLIFTYGVMGGLGFAFMYLPSIIIVNFYFEKKRLKASAFTMCGSGIGTVIGAFLFDHLIKIYGWQGCLRIVSGLILNGIVCSSLYRPLEAPISKANRIRKLVPLTEETQESEMGERGIPKSNTFKKLMEARERTTSSGSLDGAYITRDNSMIKDPKLIEHIVLETLPEEDTDYISEPLESLPNLTVETLVDSGNSTESGSLENIEEVAEEDEITSLEKLNIENQDRRRISYCETIEVNTESSTEYELESKKKLALEYKELIQKDRENGSHRSQTSSECSETSKSSSVWKMDGGFRPMYRSDIFFSGSVPSLREYQSSLRSNSSYMASFVSLPDADYEMGTCTINCLPTCFALSQMFHFSIMKSVTFLILITCNILAMMGFFIPYVHVMQLVSAQGVKRFHQILLIAIMGGINFIVRLVMGHSNDLTQSNCILLHNLALIIGGVATILVRYIQEAYQLYVVYALMYGACIAVFISLRSVVLVELLGVQKLINSFGVLLVFQGMALIIGLPLGGIIFLFQFSYNELFTFSGILLALAGIICLPVRRVARYEYSRNLRIQDSLKYKHREQTQT